jgi:chitinase
LALAACVSLSRAQTHDQGKIFGGYFEEWGVRYANYNIADLQKSGVADELTHLLYAFGNVTANGAPACAIADPSAPIKIRRFRS